MVEHDLQGQCKLAKCKRLLIHRHIFGAMGKGEKGGGMSSSRFLHVLYGRAITDSLDTHSYILLLGKHSLTSLSP